MSEKNERKTSIRTCVFCHNKGQMKILCEYNNIKIYGGDSCFQDGGWVWELTICEVCKKESLVKYAWVDCGDIEQFEVLYPQTKDIQNVPDTIATAYVAANKVKHIDANAFAVLLGRVLEEVCIDQNAKGKHLNHKIKDLADQGIIPARLNDLAHNLRILRNMGAHVDSGKLTPKEVPVLESLCKAILEYVYTVPALIEAAKERVEQLKNS